MVEPAGADGAVEVREVGVGERPPSGPIARPWRGLGQGWPVPIRRTPRFWTVSRSINASSAKARLCPSFAETGDLPAMIRPPAQIGAGNHRPHSLARPGKPA